MKILFVHTGYWPYMAATNRALTDLTQYLAAQGHEVHVICSGPSPKDPNPDSETNQTTFEGVSIHRIRDLNIPSLGISSWNSPFNFIKFFLQAGFSTLLWSFCFDIIVTLDLPPGMGVWGTLSQFITVGKARHVCWVMDLITVSRFQLGLWQHTNLLHKFINYLQTEPYRHASLCIVLGTCMQERLQQMQVQSSRISIVGIWHYSNNINVLPFGTPLLCSKDNLYNKFVVMYSGYASSLHAFQTIREVIHALEKTTQIHFLLVGDSPPLVELESYTHLHGLNNLTRIAPVAWHELSSILGVGHLHLVTLKEDMQGYCVPSKLYGIMAAGRPTLFIGPSLSQAAIDLLAAEAGFVFSSNDTTQIVSKIQYLATHPENYHELGRNARNHFLINYDYPIRCHLWEKELKALK